MTVGVWYHVAVTLNAGDSVRFYVNGAPAGTLLQTAVFGITNNNALKIGAVKSYDFTFLGAMDDLRIYSKALSGTEIQQIYNSGNLKANNSIPADGATNVSLTQDISWTAGYGAASHDVYFGTAASPPLVSSGQTATTYDTGTMATGTKYYWRIDEHNTGGTTIGFVWSFTTIPPPPGAASNPTPANGATSVSVT